MFVRIAPLLLAGLVVAGCAADAGEQEAAEPAEVTAASTDEVALDQVRASYVERYNQHDAAAVANLFTDSAFALWADGAVNMGKPAILANLQQSMTSAPTLQIETDETMVFGDRAVARGSYQVSSTLEGGSAMSFSGSYITYFERENGEWKVAGVTTNFDAPPPEGMPMAEAEGEPPPEDGMFKEFAAQWAQAFGAGDWAALGSLYTGDAVAAYTNSPPLEGPAAIQARYAETFTGGQQQIELHDVGSIELADGWALDGGWYELTGTTADGSITRTGTYMLLLQRQQDGSWKIRWSVSNGQPQPAA